MHIQQLTGAQLWGRGEASPALFQNQNTCSDFVRKGPDCVLVWVKCSTQNIVLKAPWGKNSKRFPAEPLFLAFLIKCLLKCPSSTTPSSCTARKNSWSCTCTHALYLKPDAHSEPSQRFKMEFFAKIVKKCN